MLIYVICIYANKIIDSLSDFEMFYYRQIEYNKMQSLLCSKLVVLTQLKKLIV